MSNSDSTLSTTRWCMSTGTRPSSFACTAAGSGGGVADCVGEAEADAGPAARGELLPPPQAAAASPTAPIANSERRDRDWSGTAGWVPSCGGGKAKTVRPADPGLTSQHEKGFHIGY